MYVDDRGLKHRIGGPAVEGGRDPEYWFHGYRVYSQEHFRELIAEHGTEEDHESVLAAMLADSNFFARMDHDELDWWDEAFYGVEFLWSHPATYDRHVYFDEWCDIDELLTKRRQFTCITPILGLDT